MSDFIREAGWGIYPVLLFGAISFAVAIRYAVAPKSELLPLVIGFGVATIIAGALGTTTGLQATATYVANTGEANRWIFVEGLRESLNNMDAALLIAALNALAATVGSYRLAKLRSAALAEGAAARSPAGV
ncbi:MAG: hypothetical protein IPK60_09010 [Sandaracinaceae bacterium]|jgi:uncharacterized membrane protein|nr:hypothetical protein [Sandaracinaceae bacterium]